MPTFQIRHVTTYRYRAQVGFGEHRMMFRPRPSADQRLRAFTIDIRPRPTEITWCEDVAGNHVGFARFAGRAEELRFEAALEVDQDEVLPWEMPAPEGPIATPITYSVGEQPDLAPFLARPAATGGEEVETWAASILADARGDALAFLSALAARAQR
ncbi:MAG: hypothetical protein JO048_16205, partial [Methylobacteriaceae bacterium]|nr:hypothetical protein [Methylobacteriaceae bacterium]